MMRQLILAALLGMGLAQGPGPKPENRESSYTSYDSGYQAYGAQPYPYGAQNAHFDKFNVGRLLHGLVLPSTADIITGIIYVVSVAGVAGVVLVGLALVLKLFSLKLPIITDIKEQVLSKVEKVDARAIESAWQTLMNSLENYQFS